MIRIEFNSDGFKQLLMSDETRSLISGHVDAIKARADANLNGAESQGFSARTIQSGWGGGRWVGFVGTTDMATMIAESEDKALTKAVHG